MNTQEKIEQALEFFHSSEHKLIGGKSEIGISLNTYFDIEVSLNTPNIDFSHSIPVENQEEAVTILERIAIKKERSELEKELSARLSNSGIGPDKSFILTFKGNRR